MPNTNDPLATLYTQGLTSNHETYEQSSSLSVDGEEVVNKVTGYGVATTWTLPNQAPIQAAFGSEQVHHKVIKIFKREIQTGDDAFDNVVYIETSTKKQTAALLENADFRAVILSVVKNGGSISIEENEVIFDTVGKIAKEATPNEAEMARFLSHLLGKA